MNFLSQPSEIILSNAFIDCPRTNVSIAAHRALYMAFAIASARTGDDSEGCRVTLRVMDYAALCDKELSNASLDMLNGVKELIAPTTGATLKGQFIPYFLPTTLEEVRAKKGEYRLTFNPAILPYIGRSIAAG